MKRFSPLAAVALAIGILVAAQPNAAQAQSRYATPQVALLPAELTTPWLLQLSNQPVQLGTRPNRQFRATVSTQRSGVIYRGAPTRESTFTAGSRQARQASLSPTRRRTETAPVDLASKKPQFDPEFEPQVVAYQGSHTPGTIIVDTEGRFLFLVLEGGQARRYGIGVGRPGFEWAGTHKVTRKAEWPDWRPPAQMIEREKRKGRVLPEFVPGGVENPLGARALYLGSTLYRIHGTNQPWTIGQAVSSGCIRMRNEDVMDLYERVGVGAKVIVS